MPGFYLTPSHLLLIAIVVVAVLVVARSIRVANQYERGVVFRLGKFNRTAGPGLYLVWPLVEWQIRLDLRVVTTDVEQQEGITRDNVPIKVNAVIWFRIVDPERAVMQVREVANAVDALVAAIDRGDMGRRPDDQKKNDEPNSLDRTRVGSVESRFSSPEKDKSPPSELATAGEKHDVRTNAKLRAQAKRPVTDRTTVGQATANIRSTSQVALASRNSSPCTGSCSERAPPLFGVGF